jgi:hypothetical protein
MQIKTVHQLQNALDKTIKAVKFAWRHLFVFCVFAMLLIAFVSYPAIDWQMFGFELISAIFLDWLKTNDRFSRIHNSHHQYHQAVAESFRQQSAWANNPSKEGSPAWNCNPFNVGSSAYYSRKMSQYH